MAERTKIQWCDDTCNGQMGCDGCELWNEDLGIRRCYAGKMTEGMFRGLKGWPQKFTEPVLFPERIDKACKWKDLTGTRRSDKPWLDGLPRVIFLNDMGDTFAESLPVDWMASKLGMMAESPHVWIVLTKRPLRMLEFWDGREIPANFWLCTSLTNKASLPRLKAMRRIAQEHPENPVLGLSVEPLWEDLELKSGDLEGFSWAKIGGESGPQAKPCRTVWIRRVMRACRDAGTAVFVKQLGSKPIYKGEPLKLKDGHGGDWSEWPKKLRVRQMPVRLPVN